jgi:hypothetical protein
LKEAFTTAWDRRLDRRDLLRDGAGLAVAAGLAGCGVGNIERGSLAETEKPIRSGSTATSSTSITRSTSTPSS